MAKPKVSKNKTRNGLARLQRVSLWSFNNPRKTALIWLTFVLFGAACYGTLLKREGFPSIVTPLALGQGSYLVNDPAKVDKDVAVPLNKYVVDQKGVKTVQTQSFDNFYATVIYYKDNVDSKVRSQQLSKSIASEQILPPQATLQLSPLEFGFTTRGDDLVISIYSNDPNVSTESLVEQGNKTATFIKSKNLLLVRDASVIDPFESATNPFTGATETNQKSFDRFSNRENEVSKSRKSVVVGVQAQPAADNIELDAQLRGVITELNQQPESKGYVAVVSGSFAPQIKEQISTLQTSLLEGLLAVLIVGSLVIAIRASIVTVISMITVIAITNGLLYLFGYSLNTITLFGLILGLSLIVDDTIIMVEAIDVQRRRNKDPGVAVSTATGKVSKAMIAATSTAVLSFAPLIFVGGILGSFIRAIPITIIAALLTSLFVALVFIPFFARYLLLSKKQMGEENVHERSAGIEAAIARFISGPMLWAKGSTKKLFGVGTVALFIGFGFIVAGGFIFQKVTFNIFPNSKDGNQLTTTITYNPNTDINQAQKIASDVDKIIIATTGEDFVKSSYFGQANIQTATQTIDITDYSERDITAPQLVEQLNTKYKQYKGATVKAGQNDAGPPAAAFVVQVESSKNRPAATKLAEDIEAYLQQEGAVKRPNGDNIAMDKVSLANTSIYTRTDNKQFVAVEVKYVDTDTTTLVNQTRDAVEAKFGADKVASYGLPKDAITFNAGQEDENQDSFKTLAIAFPILLMVIYVVLAFQFRSLLQPAVIFMALPFSFFGITLGLYLTDNAFSFFAMLGFFALIGLSIKNTILLTDFANQARKAGMHPVDAAHAALAERFRPLIATSLTAVFSLIPLALSSPFWEGVAVVLIFGLLSSTFLVVTVFPYYYLGAEFLRLHINRRTGVAWLILTIALMMVLYRAGASGALLAPIISALLIWGTKKVAGRAKT